MKRPSSSSAAFTLIEMLTVMAVIAVLASLIVAVNAFAHKKAALTRAQGEIQTMGTQLENYKADFGSYPRDTEKTDKIDPRNDGDPSVNKYKVACLVLYKALSGDATKGTTVPSTLTGEEIPDGKPESKVYFEFTPSMLHKTSEGHIQYIQDPFGNCYGYSTAGAAADEKFRADLQKDPTATRTGDKGFNPNYDLWSTGGVVSSDNLNDKRKRWVKNW
jgi:prepilin-type N-terminal cleavage/methylation domain-containing protein